MDSDPVLLAPAHVLPAFEGAQELFPFVGPADALEIFVFLPGAVAVPVFFVFPETPFGSYIPSISAFPYLRAESSPDVDEVFFKSADGAAVERVGFLTGADVPAPFEVPLEVAVSGCFRKVDGELLFTIDEPASEGEVTGEEDFESRVGEAKGAVPFAMDLFIGALDAGAKGCSLRGG